MINNEKIMKYSLKVFDIFKLNNDHVKTLLGLTRSDDK